MRGIIIGPGAEAVKRHPPSNPAHGGLLGAMEWLEKLDPGASVRPCDAYPADEVPKLACPATSHNYAPCPPPSTPRQRRLCWCNGCTCARADPPAAGGWLTEGVRVVVVVTSCAATVPMPCEPEPEPAQAPGWGEPGWDPTSPAITAVAGPAAAAAASGGGGGATSASGRRLNPHTLEALWSDQR
jgi:hypothetical protein